VAALPNEGELLELLGALQLARGDQGQAHKTLSDLVALRPRSPEAWVRLAEVDIARKNYRQALGNARKALEVKQDFVPALRHVMALELELGNPSAARALIKDMQQQPSLKGVAAVFEGDLEAQQESWGAAAGAYRQALGLKVPYPTLAGKAHRALVMAGKGPEAQTFSQRWLQDNPGDLLFVAYLADSALARSDWAEARSRYEFILKKAPNDAAVMNNLAWVLLRTKQVQDAESMARKAVALRPQAGAILDTLSEVLSAAGKHDEAIQQQRRAVELENNSPIRRVALAKRYIAASQRDKAKIELDSVAQLGARYPGQAEVQALLKQL
jgi:putative PEP-CTERM system TPR-repeat lipoprotein